MTSEAQPSPIGLRLKGVVPALSSLDLDTLENSNFRALRYFLTGWDANNKTKSMDILANNDDNVLNDTIFGRVGADLSFEVEIFKPGANTILKITNPNAFSITVEAIRFIIGQ